MGEEIKIVVKQESQGNAIGEAREQVEQLNREAQRVTQRGGVASGTDPMREQARRFMEEEARREAEAAAAKERKGAAGAKAAQQEAASIDKAMQMSSLLEANQRRAAGDETGARALEREVRILQQAEQIQRALNVDRERAVQLARQDVEAVEKAQAARVAAATSADAVPAVGGIRGALGRIFGGRGSTLAATVVAGVELGQHINENGQIVMDAQASSRERAIASMEEARRRRRDQSYITGSAERSAYIEGDKDRRASLEAEQRGIEDSIKKERNARWMNAASTIATSGGAGFIGGSMIPGIGNVAGTIAGVGVGVMKAGSDLYTSFQKEKELNEQLKTSKGDSSKTNEDLEEQKRLRKEDLDLEMGIVRAQQQHTMEGAKQAVNLSEQLRYKQEYHRLLQVSGGDKGLAAQGAEALVREDMYQRGIRGSAGMVNAMSGSGDSARAAMWAERIGSGSTEQILREIRDKEDLTKFAKDPVGSEK